MESGAAHLRVGFRRELDEINTKVIRLFALVSESVSAATAALLDGDTETARQLSVNDAIVDELNADVEMLVQRQFTLQAPLASDMRFLLAVLRMVPELERSADLAEHIAQRAAHGLTPDLTPRLRGLIEQMGAVNVQLWRMAADAYAECDPEAAAKLNKLDDTLDDLHDDLLTELMRGELPLPSALQTALVGRFYERLGDHAVHVTERVRYIAGAS